MKTRKYYYSKMDIRTRKICDLIVKQLKKYKGIIIIRDSVVSSNELIEIFEIIDKDFPELFYIDIKKRTLKIIDFKYMKIIIVSFLYSKSHTKKLQSDLNNASLNIITHALEESTILGREKIICDYLTTNVKYQKDKLHINDYNIVGPLINKQAICEGYAKTFKYLCELTGLNCLIVKGMSYDIQNNSMDRHAWNIIYLGNNLYAHIDVTWNCAYSINNYPLYNLTDLEIEKDHIWNKSIVPTCSSKGQYV